MIVSGNLKRFIVLTSSASAVSYVSTLVIPNLAAQNYDNTLFAITILFSLLFSAGIAVFFKTGIIRAINERYVLLINIVFIYFLFASHSYNKLNGIFFLYALFATALTLFNAFTQNPLTRLKKIYLYVWLIFMSSFMMIKDMVSWFKTDASLFPELFTPFAIVIKGMSFCMLFSYVAYLLFFLLFGLIDFDKEIKITRQHPTLRNIIDRRFSNEQLTKYEALLIIVIGSGALITNHFLQIITYQILVGILIITLPFLANKKQK